MASSKATAKCCYAGVRCSPAEISEADPQGRPSRPGESLLSFVEWAAAELLKSNEAGASKIIANGALEERTEERL